MSNALGERLDTGLAALGLEVESAVRERLLAFVALLNKWNRAYNLTAVRDPQTMVTRHLLDALAVLPFIEGPRLLDVGSGAGLPGIVLAIARPDIAVTSVDSVGKKIRFQRQVLFELGIDNVTALNERVEQLGGARFEQIISRAFAAPDAFVALTRHLLTPGGHWLAMVGQAEIDALPEQALITNTRALRVPGEQGQRHLLTIEAR
ncbi:16S rRNA (guanine(527)-N(7))-methyltransferase RsmG [Kushneria aurantia]|uniref:Ribosomal RNA small subunit methyltransferase G n=1 Tax=Kushneria aurantia TaxID=504092 RepID=A0ABV6G0F1_9GAMM|nr:16S rRNA (guanine(527)-N(7))-methyltransferase RsmG [Kushneria aurantia]